VLDTLTIGVLKESSVGVGLTLLGMRAVAEIVQEIATVLLEVLHLGLRKHSLVAAQVLPWVSFQFVHTGAGQAFSDIVLDALLNNSTLDGVDTEDELEELAEDGLRVHHQIFIADVVARDLSRALLFHDVHHLVGSGAQIENEAIPPVGVGLVKWHRGDLRVAHGQG